MYKSILILTLATQTWKFVKMILLFCYKARVECIASRLEFF